MSTRPWAVDELVCHKGFTLSKEDLGPKGLNPLRTS